MIVAAGLAAAVYLNALHNPFVYDDRDTVVQNPSLVDLTNVRFLLLYSLFRPAVNLSYAFDRGVWGFQPFGFHLTNIALHVVVVVLFCVWCRCALSDVHGGAERHAEWPAFFAAAVYAVHPLMTEAVGYVSGRSEVLCAASFLSALLLARRAIVAGSRLAAVGAAAAGAVAFASKESAAALPVVLLAYDRWVLSADPERRREFRRRLVRVYVPVLLIVAAGAIVRLRSLVEAEALVARNPIANLLTQAVVIWRYLGLFLLPVGQTIMHPVQFLSAADPKGIVALAALAGSAAAAFALRRREPLIAVGVVWFLAALAPSSSIIPLREGMAEHRLYVGTAGLLLAGASLLARPLATRTAARGAAAFVVCVLAVLTVQRNRVWAHPAALWEEAADRAPDMWEPHYAYADALRSADDCERAVVEYQKVIALRPRHRDALTNLGICLAQTDRPSEAESALREAIAVDPSWARGYTNLAALAIAQGDYARARDNYLQALARDPRNVLARMQLARLYEGVFHDYHAAARMCGEARAIDPSTPGVVECVERNQRLAAAHDAGH